MSSPTYHRSGAVARMLRMPVATLRIWERRYALTRPALSPSGQRLYSADDVRRLALIKQLTELGHAIGSLARLDMAQLQQVAATHAAALAARPNAADLARAPARGWRLIVVGRALYRRLQKPALLQRLGAGVELLGPFDNAAEAATRAAQADAVLLHEPQLHAGWIATLDADAPDLAPLPRAVLYRYATEAVSNALADAGLQLLREPQHDAGLAQWLRALSAAAPAGGTPAQASADALPPRRWDDAALADFAGLSTTIACECPRHVAELLVQLSHFEDYSAQCAHRGPADAELHAYLGRVAARCRASLEVALEHVARHEGLLLPR